MLKSLCIIGKDGLFCLHIIMNIFDTVYELNSKHLNKRAMSITMDNGSKRIYSYGEIFSAVEKYADTLIKAGVKAGDRIAFVAESSPEWNIAFFASCKLRCTAALIDASLTGDELVEFIERSDVRAAFMSAKAYEKTGDISSFKFPVFNILDCSVFEGSVDMVSADLPSTPDGDENVACIIFSSGTTRKAAGIMHYHESLIKTTLMTIGVQKLNENDRYLSIIPNSHIYGVVCLVLGPALSCSDVHFIETIAADAILGAFAEYHPTVLPAVPKVYELFRTAVLRKINSKAATRIMFKTFFPICLKLRREKGSLLGKKLFASIHEGFGGSLTFLCSAGAPLSQEVADFYYGTGFNLLITYGASETNIPTIGNVADTIQTDSCGKPYPDVQIKFSDEGEILVKSPYIMKGYFRDDEATKEAFTEDGWFKSGDIGVVNEKGYIQIVGRCKENIVLSTGKKVTPDDLEERYAGVEGIKEFVICGVPAENNDYDEIHAFAIAEREDLKAKIVADFKAKSAQMAQNMRLFKVNFVNEIPRTSLQKPKRYLLKQMAINERNSKVQVEETVSDDSLLSKVIAVVSKISGVPASQITENTKIFADLPFDSLSSVDLAMEIEDRYGVNIEKVYSKEMTVGDIAGVIENGKSDEKEDNTSAHSYPFEKTESDYRLYKTVRNLANSRYDITIKNAENMPKENGFIICPNHVSYIDYLFVSMAFNKERFKKLCCMARDNIFRNDPLSKKLVKVAGMVPIDRGGMNVSSMNSLKQKLKDGWCVLIHPEGTRSEDGIFRTIKSGASVLAIDAEVPIVPVYINGVYEIFPKGKKLPKLYNRKNKGKYKVDVVFGEAISTDGKTTEEVTAELQNAILNLQKQFNK